MLQPGLELKSVQLHLFEGPFSGRFTNWATATVALRLKTKSIQGSWKESNNDHFFSNSISRSFLKIGEFDFFSEWLNQFQNVH